MAVQAFLPRSRGWNPGSTASEIRAEELKCLLGFRISAVPPSTRAKVYQCSGLPVAVRWVSPRVS